MRKRISILLFVGFSLILPLQLFSQSAAITGNPIAIEKDIFGYNENTWLNGPKWEDTQFRYAVGRLHAGNIRYPGGTVSNYWDWRTGTIMATATTGWPKYVGYAYSCTPADLLAAISDNTSVIYCVNLARPTPSTNIDLNSSFALLSSQAVLDAKIADILEGIKAFELAGRKLKYIELGNEYYQGALGGVNDQGSIYSANPDLYIQHANQLSMAIKKVSPDAKIAVVGEDNRTSSVPTTNWTKKIYEAIAKGDLQGIDAITFHWYSGPGTLELNDAEDAMNSLVQTYNYAAKQKPRDYDNVPPGLKIWITEYNTWSPTGDSANPNNPGNGGPIQDTWTNGLFGANLSLQFILFGDRISLLNIHSLNISSNSQWRMLKDKDNLSGNGIALAMVGRAVNGMGKAWKIDFNDLPDPTFKNDWPSLLGAKFSSDSEMRESVLIFNNTDKAKNGVNIASLFSGKGKKQMMQFNSETPWLKDVSENGGISSNLNEDLKDKVDLPAFSVTVITQDQENLLVNPSFENSTDIGWAHNGQIIEDKKYAWNGVRSLRLSSEENAPAFCSQEIALQPNSTYMLSAMIQSNLTDGSGLIKVRFLNTLKNEVGVPVAGLPISGTKAYLNSQIQFKTPADASFAEIKLQLNNGTGKIWFDALVLSSKLATGISEWRNKTRPELKLLPTSQPDLFRIKLEQVDAPEMDRITVYDMMGRVQKIVLSPENGLLNIAGLPSGVYIVSVKFQNMNRLLTAKMLIK